MNIRKLTAILTISALVSSSCVPVYAGTSEDIKGRREQYLKNLALHLSDRSVTLEDKEEELNRKEAKLAELSEEIHKKNVASTVREIELDDLRAALNKDSAYLTASQKELEQDRLLLAGQREEIARRASEAEEKARIADEKSKMAGERLEKAVMLEKTIALRIEEADEKLRQIDLEKIDIIAKTSALEASSRDVAAKIAGLEREKAKLEEAKKLYAEKQKELEGIKNSLSIITAERDNAQKEAAALRAKAEESAQELSRLIQKTEAQDAVIAQLREQVRLKEEEIHAFYNPNSVVKPVGDNGSINWSDGSIRSTGKGVPPDNVTPAQGKLLARRAAILDMQRNMLETIQGVNIDAHTKMDKFMIELDTVNSAVKGTISGIVIAEESWDDDEGIYTVTGQLKQDSLAKAMKEVGNHILSGRKPKKEAPKNGARYTGLILDVKHLAVDPQKFFRIVDEKGYLVYGKDYADKNIQSRIGLCVYYENRVFTADEKARVGDNPIFIKAQRLSANGEDIVITMSDADTIRHNRIDFRKECKVIIVRS